MLQLVLLAASLALTAVEGSGAHHHHGRRTLYARAAGSSSGGSGNGNGTAKAASPEEVENVGFTMFFYIVFGSIAVAVSVYHLALFAIRYVRTLTSLQNDTQRYFARPDGTFAKVKEHLLYAPLFRNRHNREFKLSAATNFGTLPTRFQALFLAAYLGTNLVFGLVNIDWSRSSKQVLIEFRTRTGVLSVVNMVPLFIMGGRNNPLIRLLGISYDTFNMLHRWFGRVVVLEALCHTFAHTAAKIQSSGWPAMRESILHSELIKTGTIGTVAFVIILLHSPSVIRHAFYETFLHLHIALVAVSLYALWVHLKGLPYKPIVVLIVIFWVAERSTRMLMILYRNVGRGGTRAVVETLTGDAVRVTVDMARPWTFKPGQHLYLYVPSVGLWTSHPFTVGWSSEAEDVNSEKGLVVSRQDVLRMQKTSMSLIIRRRTGFTDKLYAKAEAAESGKITIRAFVEGPYGGLESLSSYGTVMLFAAGVGITHQVPRVRELIAGFNNGTVATRKIVLVWVIRTPDHLEWIRPWMTSILAMDHRREILRILLFVTRPRNTREIHSPSATVQMHPGRPNVQTLIEIESENQVGAMAVSVCGTGSFSDSVRAAVRRRQAVRNVDFSEEAFTW